MSSKTPKPPRDREHADPHEQHNPMPRIVIAIAALLVAWAIGYIVVNGETQAPTERAAPLR